MISKPSIDLFKTNVTTLEKTSRDSSRKGTKDEYMTDSKLEVINFDKVKEGYQRKNRIIDTPESNDALYWNENGRIIFIEFKNSPLENIKTNAIWKKIYDSVLIFSDIVGVGITEMRQQVEYVLVYKNDTDTIEPHRKGEDDYIPPAQVFDRHITTVRKRGGKDKLSSLKLHQFKGYCFKDVHDFTKADFENFLHSL